MIWPWQKLREEEARTKAEFDALKTTPHYEAFQICLTKVNAAIDEFNAKLRELGPIKGSGDSTKEVK